MPNGVHFHQANLIERFDSVLFPVPVEFVISELPRQGWVVPGMEESEREIKLSGPISKGDAKLALDPDKKLIGIRGTNPTETLEAFRELRKGWANWLAGIETDYLEMRLLADVVVPAGLLGRFSQLWGGPRPTDGLEKLLGRHLGIETRLAPYGIRLALDGLDPNQPRWAEVAITPSPSAADQLVRIDLIFRDRERQTVEKAMEAAESTVSDVVGFLNKKRP
jgi:hypothetical protein